MLRSRHRLDASACNVTEREGRGGGEGRRGQVGDRRHDGAAAGAWGTAGAGARLRSDAGLVVQLGLGPTASGCCRSARRGLFKVLHAGPLCLSSGSPPPARHGNVRRLGDRWRLTGGAASGGIRLGALRRLLRRRGQPGAQSTLTARAVARILRMRGGVQIAFVANRAIGIDRHGRDHRLPDQPLDVLDIPRGLGGRR